MDVTLRFYDSSCMNVFREHSYIGMKEITIASVKAALKGVFDAYEYVLPSLVSRQFVSDDEYIFNIIIDGSCLENCFESFVLDDMAYMVDRILLAHNG